MKKSYAKSQKAYDRAFELDSDKILAAMRRHRESKKKPIDGPVKSDRK
jgi:hypothetical protein